MEAFLGACDSLRGHYESLCEHLVVVLMPERGVDASAWLKWLGGVVEKAESPHVRMVVLEDARTLVLEPLAEALPERVVTIPAKLGAGRPREALEHYHQAEAAAGESEAKGEPQGKQLRLKSRMGQGAAWVTAREYPRAAALYEETAPLACEQKDARMELECWRMASWCCEVAREVERAWEHGQRAWEVGRAMDAGTRETSTLPCVGEALVRLSHERQGARAAQAMESEVKSVMGNDWRPEPPVAGGQAG